MILGDETAEFFNGFLVFGLLACLAFFAFGAFFRIAGDFLESDDSFGGVFAELADCFGGVLSDRAFAKE